MTMDLTTAVTDLQAMAPRLKDFAPTEASWKEAAKHALEIRTQVQQLLSTPQGIQSFRLSPVLDTMKRLIPQSTRQDIAQLPIADFVLGMLFEKPFIQFELVYRGFSAEYGKELSQQARQEENNTDTALTYGEVLFFSFADILYSIVGDLPPSAIFYDLGCGTGKAVVAASLVHPFARAVGIEALESLVTFAEKRLVNLHKHVPALATEIEFIDGDVLEESWEDGDVIFCHGTCFTANQWIQISLSAERLKQGAFFVSVSNVLESALFEVVRSASVWMSWGMATVYIHRRRRIGRWASSMLRGGRATRTDLRPNSSAAASSAVTTTTTFTENNDVSDH